MNTIHHVYAQVGSPNAEAERRMDFAAKTWRREQLAYGKWHEQRVYGQMLKRDATDLSEEVPLPYVHDMLDLAFKASRGGGDILLLTNADICLAEEMAHTIEVRCNLLGSTYCHRWDMPREKMEPGLSRIQVGMNGSWYVGSDLFAVTANWWSDNSAKLPPFVLGRECWDWAFRLLIGKTGGLEIERGIYHEKHPSDWEAQTLLPGNLYNRGLMRRFLEVNGWPLDFIQDKPFLPVTWP